MKTYSQINLAIIYMATLLIAGCSSGPLLEVTLVDERTALENQVLGSYAQLNQDVLLLTSVRGIDPQGNIIKRDPLPQGRQTVVRAMQRAAFNLDDLERYKLAGIIGENNRGGVTLIKLDKIDNTQLAFIKNLVAEENADREVIMLRIIQTDENLANKDLPHVRKIFSAMNRDKALKGVSIQKEDGTWQTKGNSQ
ncbi:MAG: DUF1318 domain-containing protein [Magnetococcales bacterium]|nr:DUF1318 domain-containing protein [Magnetococcales bacterium]